VKEAEDLIGIGSNPRPDAYRTPTARKPGRATRRHHDRGAEMAFEIVERAP
jgi:hypothetical protein